MLLENTVQKQHKEGKLEPLRLGPYTIHRDLGKGLYELSNQAGTVLKKKANIARLKEYVKRAQDVSHLLYTFQSLNVRYMYISNNAIVPFTMAYNHLFFFGVQDTEKSPPPSDTQPKKSPPPSDTQPKKSPSPSDTQPKKSPPHSDTQPKKPPPHSDTQPKKSPPPSDTQPKKSPPPSDTQPKKSPPLTPSPRNLPLPLTPSPRNLPL